MKTILLFILSLSSYSLQAQQGPVSAGGDAAGKTGMVSFSVGQVFFTPSHGDQGAASPGVQQTFEISEISVIAESLPSLQITVYPNPTTHFISLEVKRSESKALTFTLMEMNGKILKSGKLQETRTEILMEKYQAASYLLKVFRDNEPIKTFQIIKNN